MAYLDENTKMYDLKFSEGWGSYYPNSDLITFYHRYIKGKMPQDKKLRVLDFGCGRGNNLEFFLDRGFEVYGIDISREAIKLCEKNPRFKPNHFIQADVIRGKSIEELFDCKFDLIVATVSLTYLNRTDIKSIINQFKKCMNRQGVVIASFFEKQSAFNEERNQEGMMYSIISNLNIKHYTFVLEGRDELREIFKDFKEIAIGDTRTTFPDYEIVYTYYIGENK